MTKTTDKPKNRSLVLRIKKLSSLGIRLTQISSISGVSYTALHRFVYAKDIALTEETQAAIHRNIDGWLKLLAAV